MAVNPESIPQIDLPMAWAMLSEHPGAVLVDVAPPLLAGLTAELELEALPADAEDRAVLGDP